MSRLQHVLPTVVLTLTLAGLASCTTRGGDDGGCAAGTQGCACDNGGCGAGLSCQGNVCVSGGCTAGNKDCACKGDGTCNVGPGGVELTCTNGSCIAASCIPSSEGCACAGNMRCGINPRGEQLTCQAGVCALPSCTAGETGCACTATSTCTASSDECRSGFCRPAGCTVGELNCECAGGSCNGPALACRNGQCVDNTGFLGGPCLANSTCNGANRCEDGVCVPCTAGTLHCGCTPQGTCGSNLTCNALMVCAQPGEGAPPVTPKCYSPCESSLQVDGGAVRTCPADGLMEGCLGGTTCTQGSCVAPGGNVPTCQTDAQCPDWQTCITGQCFSTCDYDGQCQGGKRCYRHVCRTPCTASLDTCPAGNHCRSVDGENGFCLLTAPPTGEPVTEVPGGFAVSTVAIDFSNVRTTATFTIKNNSPNFQRFVVKKKNHELARADNSTERLQDPLDTPRVDGGAVACDPVVNCPLTWLRMGPPGATTLGQEYTVGIDGNAEATVELTEAGSVEAVSWQGNLEVRQDKMGHQSITVSYVERPEGRWVGNMYYFSQFGDRKLDEWRVDQASRDDLTKQNAVGNAFVQRWGAFRRGRITWDEFQAVLTATRSESWRWPSVTAVCPGANSAGTGKACYLYDIGASGVVEYTASQVNVPIPSGLTELPLAINLRLDPSDANQLVGRIESSLSLQYAGNPAVSMQFASDPSTCGMMNGGVCVTFMDRFDAQIFVGGRFIPAPSDSTCTQGRPDGSFEPLSYPWLLPGFQRATTLDPETGIRSRRECRDTKLPFAGANQAETLALKPGNIALSASNPIPDGRSRRRTMRLVDGALINQSQLFVIFEEEFPSFLGSNDSGFKAYGYMVLDRGRATLDPKDDNGNQVADVYEGSNVDDTSTQPTNLLDVSCPASLLQEILPLDPVLNAANADNIVAGILTGAVAGAPQTLAPADAEQVHYLCVDNGLFDGGEFNVTPHGVLAATNANSCSGMTNNNLCEDGGSGSTSAACPFGTDLTDCGFRQTDDRDTRTPCPAGSEVIFFTVNSASRTQQDIAGEPCNHTGTCAQKLNQWRTDGTALIQYQPTWRCTDTNYAFCDNNRFDMRDGKTFYAVGDTTQVLVPMATSIDLAFRYKTRFRNRSGSTVGFAPELCREGSDLIPYCYDPAAIEKLRERSDCLLAIWQERDTLLPLPASQAVRTQLENYLTEGFAVREEIYPDNTRQSFDGFEKLYAELLIMLGDEAYTAAFASRFDLANSRNTSFQGTRFEGDIGIDLSGVAGFEMHSLHMATQYYQETLDRFYALSPTVGMSLALGASSSNFITPLTVTTYFDRLIRASTQKSKAWSEVARRYQGFNRPDLARRVVERAFTATYLEAMVLSRMMLSVVSAPQYTAQIRRAAEDAARRYRVATMEMRKVYNSISDGVTFFGFTPDFVPLPALDANVPNAFEMVLQRAQERTRVARLREDDALAQDRSFDTDAAQFQAELTRIRNTYENQLGTLCGTFQAQDGRIYPAIKKYAQLNPRARLLQAETCGMMGNGQIHEQMLQMDLHALEIQGLKAAYDNVFEEVAIEEERVADQCDLIDDRAEYVYNAAGRTRKLREDIAIARTVVAGAERALSVAHTVAQLAKCSVIAGTSVGGDCPAAGVASALYITASAVINTTAVVAESVIVGVETDIAEIEAATAKWDTEQQCDVALVDSDASTKRTLLRLKELDVEMLKATRRVDLTLSEIRQLQNDALRLELEQEETEQLAINVEAVRNDPNVRIYKNDAIINADFSFRDAIREAYRATKVYEYYTSQSYPDQEKLFLIRMVARGDFNLENYLTELGNEFNTFEEEFGNPDTRVAVISLMDDILRVPRLKENNEPMDNDRRLAMLRSKLTDVSYLDERGYLTFPFSTTLDQLSPLTRNHKVLYVEATINGAGGDTLGRVYLRQQGTAVVRRLDGDKVYYRLPERTAVINTMFNGQRQFTPDVYRSYRLRDRPLVNTSWELVLNQRDEMVNKDINLNGLTDILLYVYYTDFTGF